jgi:hypothetical protein
MRCIFSAAFIACLVSPVQAGSSKAAPPARAVAAPPPVVRPVAGKAGPAGRQGVAGKAGKTAPNARSNALTSIPGAKAGATGRSALFDSLGPAKGHSAPAATTPHVRQAARAPAPKFDRAHQVGHYGEARHHQAFIYRRHGRAYRRAYLFHEDGWYWFDVPVADDAPELAAAGEELPDCDPAADSCQF